MITSADSCVNCCGFISHYKTITDPWQNVPAGELPGGDVGGAGVVLQHGAGSLRISQKVKLSAHCDVTSGCTYKKNQTHFPSFTV